MKDVGFRIMERLIGWWHRLSRKAQVLSVSALTLVLLFIALLAYLYFTNLSSPLWKVVKAFDTAVRAGDYRTAENLSVGQPENFEFGDLQRYVSLVSHYQRDPSNVQTSIWLAGDPINVEAFEVNQEYFFSNEEAKARAQQLGMEPHPIRAQELRLVEGIRLPGNHGMGDAKYVVLVDSDNGWKIARWEGGPVSTVWRDRILNPK